MSGGIGANDDNATVLEFEAYLHGDSAGWLLAFVDIKTVYQERFAFSFTIDSDGNLFINGNRPAWIN